MKRAKKITARTPIKFKLDRPSLLTDGAAAVDAGPQVVLPLDYTAQVLERMSALFDKYDVEKGDWPALACKLAFAHEPEFRFVEDKPAGAPVYWNAMRLFYLWFDVRNVIAQGKVRSEREACKLICSKTQGHPEYQGKDPQTLREQLIKAKASPMVQAAKRAIATLGQDKAHRVLEGLLKPETRAEILTQLHQLR